MGNLQQTQNNIVREVTIDFETRSKVDLKKCGPFKYAQDPSTSILCLAYKFSDEPEVKQWRPGLPGPTDLLDHVSAGGIVHAHNAEFEFVIWNFVGRRIGWPRVSWNQLRCSAAKAAALALPRSLENLALVVNAGVEKDMEGRRLMLKLSKPRKIKGELQFVEGTEEDKKRLYDYNKKDVLAEIACEDKVIPLSDDEQKLWEFTEMVNERGMKFDRETVETAISFVEFYTKELQEELQDLTFGMVNTGKQTARLLECLRMNGVDIPDLTAGTVKETLKRDDLSFEARRILEIRKALAMSSVSKLGAMLQVGAADNRLRGLLLYHGASTGRFSGRGVQPQNFPRGSISDVDTIFEAYKMGYDFFKMLFPNVLAAISSSLRGMLIASEGMELFAGDFAAIEARGLLWIAEDEDGLGIFRRGEDIYKEMAGEIYKVDPKKVTKDQRQVGKFAILALGYGMGAKKFVDTCLSFGVTITMEFAERVVAIYRNKFEKVKALWHNVNQKAIDAVKNKGTVYTYKRLSFLCRGNYLMIKLPSGRKLFYNSPKISIEVKTWGEVESLSFMSVNAKTKKWEREYTYGGKLVENIVQAICRDLMVYSMYKLESAGYKILITVHDEVVSERKIGEGSVKEFERLMSEAPSWAKGFPIGAEAWKGPRYKK
jgi:DNA polymerase